MLNGPALLRVFLVVVAAAVLTGLVQHYWIFDTMPPETPAVVARPSIQNTPVRRADPVPDRPASQAAATPQTTSAPKPAPAPAPPLPPEQAPEPIPVAPPENQNAALAPSTPPVAAEPAPVRPPPPQRAPAPLPPAPANPQPESGEQEVAAAEAADPRAVDLVDLNTGSLSELNGLRGGGAIGRAIIQRRPYASTDQLLSKRVLSRAIYLRIKDQVTIH